MEQRVGQVEAPGPEAPELVVDEVREGLQRAVVAAPNSLRKERVTEDPRDAAPVLDRGVVDHEKTVVPEECVAEGVQVDEHGRRHDRTRSETGWHGSRGRARGRRRHADVSLPRRDAGHNRTFLTSGGSARYRPPA